MNLFKIEQGGFFGIIIPGALLYINLIISINGLFPKLDLINYKDGLTFNFSIIGIIFSIILGYLLRMLTYDYTECFRKSKFPYFRKFFNENWDLFPKDYKDFYLEYIKINLKSSSKYKNKKGIYIIINNNIKLAKIIEKQAKILINYFKVEIIKESSDLKSEILYLEGVSRLIIGTIYALTLSIILNIISFFNCCICSNESIIHILFIFIYFLLIIIMYRNLPKIREKEVVTILEAFKLINKKN